MKKKCKSCKEFKDVGEFRTAYNTLKDGSKSPHLRGSCKRCERERARANTFKTIRGITYEERDQMLEEQGNQCACCGSFESGSRKGWHVDHCHRSDKIRGILCANCNIALGQVDDSICHLRLLIHYLEQHGHC